MVYQFPLAPLILHTFLTSNTTVLNKWVNELRPDGIFFNFIASHDGIGIMPAKGLLNEIEIESIVDRTLDHQGKVSYKSNSDGSKSVYELNITLYDWLNDPNNPQTEMDVKRFLASQAIMISLVGVPGIYIHSFFGSRNCLDCVDLTGRARSINREKFTLMELESDLHNPNSMRAKVFNGYIELLNIRSASFAFHPEGTQKVIDSGKSVFGLIRLAPDESETILCFINVSNTMQYIDINLKELNVKASNTFLELLTKTEYFMENSSLKIDLTPYQAMWLSPNG
jgi:sucrose phosphorylase